MKKHSITSDKADTPRKRLGVHWHILLSMLLMIVVSSLTISFIIKMVAENSELSDVNMQLARHMEGEVQNVANELVPLYRGLHAVEVSATRFLAKFELWILDSELGKKIVENELNGLKDAFESIPLNSIALSKERYEALKESVFLMSDIYNAAMETISPNQLTELLRDSEDVFLEFQLQIDEVRNHLDDLVVSANRDISTDVGIAAANTSQQQDMLEQLKKSSAWSLFFLIGFVLFVGITLLRSLQYRLAEVSSYAKSIAEGQYSAHMAFESKDKIGEMSEAVADMGGRMASLVQESERKARIAEQAEQRIRKLAFFDSLTGLPNRQFFNDILVEAIEESSRLGEKFAVIFMDLDNFKNINDVYGHDLGDELLRSVAGRLKHGLRPDDIIAHNDSEAPVPRISRLGGDEFTFMIGRLHERGEVAQVANRIRRLLAKPHQLAGRELVVTPSLGIALYPDDGKNVEALLKNSDLAMYQAKADGRNNFKFYNAEVEIKQVARFEMERDLGKAIERNELSLHYQPKVDLETNEIVGAEALLRWQHPERGMVSPAEFIPLAEESSLILSIGTWVMEQVCQQISSWKEQQVDFVPIAINLSPRQLIHTDVLRVIRQSMKTENVAAEDIELEITESALMEDTESAIDTLSRLKEIGIKVSLDDFGTGYSSLSYLKRFPLDTLKIDRSFIRDLETDEDDAGIVRAILALASLLDLNIVAEGIENQYQLDFLRKHNCTQGQGYLFSKPLPQDEFMGLLHIDAKSAVS